jgi:hypothetical protein
MNILIDYKKYFNIINNFTDIKAHNPLVDAYYTFIIFIVFELKKSSKFHFLIDRGNV